MSPLSKALLYVSIFSPIFLMFLMLIYRKKMRQKYFIWFGLLILAALATDVISLNVAFDRSFPTAYLLNYYNVIQFILLLLIYREFYLKTKLTILILCLVYFPFEIFNSLYFQNLNDNQTWSWAFSGLILFLLSIGYFTHLLKYDTLTNIKEHAPAWINGAIFLYFGFSLYLFIMAEYVFTNASPNAAFAFWGFHNFNNILKNCMFGAGIYFGCRRISNSAIN